MGDLVARSLLAMAETLRTQTPPKYKMAIKCAMAALKNELTPAMTAYCHFQLGKLLHFYSENAAAARNSLLTAYQMMRQQGEMFAEQRLQCFCLICEIYMADRTLAPQVPNLIREELVSAKAFPLMHAKLLLLCAEEYVLEDKAEQALATADAGIKTQWANPITELYFRLTKNLISARMLESMDEVEMKQASVMLQQLPPTSPEAANLRHFYLATSLALMFSDGKVRSSKMHLRQLQQDAQQLSALPPAQPGLRWAEPTMITVLTCVLTLAGAVQQCNLERASKYYQIAIKHIFDYIGKGYPRALEPCVCVCVERMRLLLDELMAQAHVVACQPRQAMANVRMMVDQLGKSPSLQPEFYPKLHILLGQYLLYHKDLPLAEQHLQLAAAGAVDKNTAVIATLNLATLYLTACKHAEFYEIADRITVKGMSGYSSVIRAATRFVHALHAYLNNRLADGKQHVSECLDLARTEDMYRLNAMNLLLFATMFPNAGTPDTFKSTSDCVTKAHDQVVLYWTNHLAMVAQHRAGNTGGTAELEASIRANRARLDRLAAEKNDNPLHVLTQWLSGDPEAFVPKA